MYNPDFTPLADDGAAEDADADGTFMVFEEGDSMHLTLLDDFQQMFELDVALPCVEGAPSNNTDISYDGSTYYDSAMNLPAGVWL
ncbi:hypothetical protein PPSIR1_37299 [Plesiocystis pacifica SIR-1]|uniref:Uncharacterized protein n=1 Tax=Plesiocystis pacifica SIR-1 TaxID=391625 RepID=A6G0M5_9BACT|nr:hypothetical protein [Plesiocystis pacifica]EDM80671.1 hypothetical protein PPSIR1_37299 [Plesiocystis pacifica SIR-1]